MENKDIVLQQDSDTTDDIKTCSIGRRILALIIDITLLGLIGGLTIFAGAPILIGSGIFAGILGLVIAILYFSILNSNICSGQTVGQKLLKIVVTDDKGEKITFKSSLLRAFLINFPIFLAVCPMHIKNFYILVLYYLLLIIAYGVFIPGFLILFFLDTKNRQSIHDVICKTHVIDRKNENYRNFPVDKMGHKVKDIRAFKILSAMICIFLGIYYFFLINNFTKNIVYIDKVNNIANQSKDVIAAQIPEYKSALSSRVHQVFYNDINVEKYEEGGCSCGPDRRGCRVIFNACCSIEPDNKEFCDALAEHFHKYLPPMEYSETLMEPNTVIIDLKNEVNLYIASYLYKKSYKYKINKNNNLPERFNESTEKTLRLGLFKFML